MTTTLTSATFDAFTSQACPTLVLFWSTSCGPCLRFHRIYKAVDTQFPDIPFGEAEVEIQQKLVRELEISTIPALLVFRDGELVYRDPTPAPENGTFSTLADAPRFLSFMHNEEKFVDFVRGL